MNYQDHPLNLAPVFFNALEYPEYARPEFFISEQRKSGWSKGIYLTTLLEVYHLYVLKVDIVFGAQKRKNPDLKIDDIKLSPKEMEGVQAERLVNKSDLDSLHYAVHAAQFVDKPSKIYSPYQILTFVEKALGFILKEFKEQLNRESDLNFRPRTTSYFIYLIAQDAPFFDFPSFKNAFRELLFTTSNMRALSNVIKQYEKTCKEIVKLWNEEVSYLDQKSNNEINAGTPEFVMVEFHGSTLKHSWWNDKKLFEARPYELFHNQNLAFYAANIANVINDDLLHGRVAKVQVPQKEFLPDFIRGVRHLMDKHEKEICIKNILDGIRHEGPFRDYFSRWFEAQDYRIYSEVQRGSKHIDLRIEHPSLGRKVVEFKGWWNKDKQLILMQLFSYLTDFEGDGYIVMINHSRRSIVEAYRKIVSTKSSGFVKNSWKAKSAKPSSFTYYTSVHQFNSKPKTVVHFFLNIHVPEKP